ncbi:hypothetical protein B0H10DRAFT_921759 [Mycena sp. CBHHK59/15]|nr:hypothetical protein B0H10DRAFT_921759 [Mycena sp. CBHHK59/15]
MDLDCVGPAAPNLIPHLARNLTVLFGVAFYLQSMPCSFWLIVGRRYSRRCCPPLRRRLPLGLRLSTVWSKELCVARGGQGGERATERHGRVGVARYLPCAPLLGEEIINGLQWDDPNASRSRCELAPTLASILCLSCPARYPIAAIWRLPGRAGAFRGFHLWQLEPGSEFPSSVLAPVSFTSTSTSIPLCLRNARRLGKPAPTRRRPHRSDTTHPALHPPS